MSEQLFSEAMGELSDKYITEAIEYRGKKKEQNLFFLVKRCVAVASIIFIVAFGILLAVNSEVRAAVWGWVREFAGGVHYKYFFEGEAIGSTEEETGSIKYYPGWLPEGTEYVTTIEEVGGEIHIYTNENDALIRFSYTTDPKAVTYIDGVEYIQKAVTVNGCEGTIYLAPNEGQTNSIIWTDDSIPVIFFFAADCSEEDLIKVAENVQVKEPESVKYYMDWLPEGSEFVTSYEIPGGESYVYTNENDAVIQLTYTTDTESTLFVDGADYLEKPVTVNGCAGTIYLSQNEEETNSIIWTDDTVPVMFFFSGDCNEEELLKVAENVKVKEQ